jgi:hypothetical protein
MKGDELCTIIWLENVPVPGKFVVEAHCVAALKWHRRWVTKGVIRALSHIYCDVLNLDALIAQTPTAYHRRIWSGLGAEDHVVYALLKKNGD